MHTQVIEREGATGGDGRTFAFCSEMGGIHAVKGGGRRLRLHFVNQHGCPRIRKNENLKTQRSPRTAAEYAEFLRFLADG